MLVTNLVRLIGRPAAAAIALAALVAPALAAPKRKEPRVTRLHQLTAKTLEGQERPLAEYQGKVVLVVNTASECGSTPQYAGLQALWERYRDKGLVVLGFPSNDFGQQEPGTAAQIATFCKTRYGVTFPLFEKGPVSGKAASPVFRFLAGAKGEPKWNFHKYLVGKDGAVIAAFGTKVQPDDPALIAAIDAALAAP